MRQISTLVERGWYFEVFMGTDKFFYASASHGKWGDAKGASDDFNEAIKEMSKAVKKLEKAWR